MHITHHCTPKTNSIYLCILTLCILLLLKGPLLLRKSHKKQLPVFLFFIIFYISWVISIWIGLSFFRQGYPTFADTAVVWYNNLTERNCRILRKVCCIHGIRFWELDNIEYILTNMHKVKKYFCNFEIKQKTWNDSKLGFIYPVLGNFIITVLKWKRSNNVVQANFFCSSIFI